MTPILNITNKWAKNLTIQAVLDSELFHRHLLKQ